jgi:hypothetical protein
MCGVHVFGDNERGVAQLLEEWGLEVYVPNFERKYLPLHIIFM